MTDLATAVCSITPTQRRRYFWAAWWTDVPNHAPFRKPDASNGGASSLEEALADAERVAQRKLVLIEPYWARAWKCVLRGQPAPPPPSQTHSRRAPSHAAPPASAWSVLGLEPGATLSEVKRAFRARALETHPDRGGDAELFRAVQQAYEKLCAKLAKKARARP
jgi:hypothetical protein